MHFRALLIAGLLMFSAAAALPGVSTSPQALGLNLALKSGEVSKLVYINGAQIRNVQPFVSAAGRTHLKFSFTAEGEVHQAIIFAGEWKPADQAQLARGTASLVGVWDSFANQPSLTVKKVSATAFSPQGQAAPARAQVVRIDRAQVNVPSIRKFTSSAQKVHVTYTFTVAGKVYQGVVYAGTWTSATLEALRSGRATLYGTWSTYAGKPSFITTRVDR